MKNPGVDEAHTEDRKSSAPYMRGSLPACAVTSCSKVGTAGRIACVTPAGWPSRSKHPRSPSRPFTNLGVDPKGLMIRENGVVITPMWQMTWGSSSGVVMRAQACQTLMAPGPCVPTGS